MEEDENNKSSLFTAYMQDEEESPGCSHKTDDESASSDDSSSEEQEEEPQEGEVEEEAHSEGNEGLTRSPKDSLDVAPSQLLVKGPYEVIRLDPTKNQERTELLLKLQAKI